ncbi:MAG: deoxyribodipyrimidine photo-lyase [Bacteroidetes bacterium]|nr:deoxyribodipyrimidine photo-lyase [Bacteroidota bacterium]
MQDRRKEKVSVFWFRRDLRIEDNAGLYHALKSGLPVIPIFIFDKAILENLPNKSDARVEFIVNAVHQLQKKISGYGSTILSFHCLPLEAFTQLQNDYNILSVYTNHDYEPYARKRDSEIAAFLEQKNIAFKTYKDQVIFEKEEILKDNGEPYTVFTPYSKKWKSRLNPFYLKAYPTEKYTQHFYKNLVSEIHTLPQLGFEKTGIEFPPDHTSDSIIQQYAKQRDIPGIHGTSRLSVHLRFGTISIRAIAVTAKNLSETFLNELIWRDFYQMILWHFPKVADGLSFKPAYDNIEWRKDNGEFEKWCNGQTGYPIVDAGMRELNSTGYMHNRVRMIVASFLCKHLLLDWRLGEAYFAEKLLDFDLAANNGGWQWASGSGCDAAPYFRIFNPYLQTKKFDPEFNYIKRWVPEFQEFSYPSPIVDHEFARKRCLEAYSKALSIDKKTF